MLRCMRRARPDSSLRDDSNYGEKRGCRTGGNLLVTKACASLFSGVQQVQGCPLQGSMMQSDNQTSTACGLDAQSL